MHACFHHICVQRLWSENSATRGALDVLNILAGQLVTLFIYFSMVLILFVVPTWSLVELCDRGLVQVGCMEAP